ncbi:MAG: hypothetical protein WA888_17040 [Burkholderiaceae bacterium]
MALPGQGCFIAWYDLQPGQDADHDHWHTHEHMIERVAIPGFLRGLRYRSLTGSPRTCVMYHVETLTTLNSPAYLKRLNHPTPWSSQTLKQFSGMNRTMCAVASSYGLGIGGYLLTIQLSARAGREKALRDWLSADTLPGLARRAGLCGAHLLIGDRGVSQTPTQEKELRGVPDAVADWVVLVEAYDRSALEQVKAELLGEAGVHKHGASNNPVGGLYSLDYTLGEDEAKRVWQEP